MLVKPSAVKTFTIQKKVDSIGFTSLLGSVNFYFFHLQFNNGLSTTFVNISPDPVASQITIFGEIRLEYAFYEVLNFLSVESRIGKKQIFISALNL